MSNRFCPHPPTPSPGGRGGADHSPLSPRERGLGGEGVLNIPVSMKNILTASFIALTLAMLAGCKKPPRTASTDPGKDQVKKDPWEVVGKRLKKDTDFPTCQFALQTLNEDLRGSDAAVKPIALSAEAEQAIAAVMPLNPADREEIHAWTYSSHDAAYLSDCFYLRDIAQGVKLHNLPPEQLADLAFAWVCRSVALEPWLIPIPNDYIAAALPPTSVLRRGSGSALERMYVFLALLQQLDLDGCLIGPNDPGVVGKWSALKPGTNQYREALPGGPARPFWAVGVRIGSEIKLYDPWREVAFPAYLSKLKANPEAYKNWLDDSANVENIKSEDLKTAKVYLTAPVSAISPRMEMLHQRLKEGVDVRLAMNPAAMRSAFPDPKPEFWNPLNDRFAYGRTSRTFLPRDLGGADESPVSDRLYTRYLQDLLPASLKQSFPILQDKDAKNIAKRLWELTTSIYVEAFIKPRDARDLSPRERIQRGQFHSAALYLTEKQDSFGRGLELLRKTPNVDEQVQEWLVQDNFLYERLGSTILANPADRASAEAQAREEIERHWRDNAGPAGPVTLMINRISAALCAAEANYLFALCQQEIAEQKQARVDYAPITHDDASTLKKDVSNAWSDARRAWLTYLERSASIQANIPGRVARAKEFSARAEKFASIKP